MKWVREYGWVAVLVLGVVYFIWLRPARGPDPKEAIARLEKQRAVLAKERAERDTRRAELDAEIARLHTDHTLFRLRILGEIYRDHLGNRKKLPQPADLADVAGDMVSARDNQPFEIVWGVDLAKLPNGGTGYRLAWEKTGAADGSRCVLLADAKTARVATAAEFAALPAAEPEKATR